MPVDYDALLALPPCNKLDVEIVRLAEPDPASWIDVGDRTKIAPNYSRDLNAAMQLTIPGYSIMVCGNEAAAGKRYATAFEDSTSQTGDNPAHAVCRVWLYAASLGYFVPPGLARESER